MNARDSSRYSIFFFLLVFTAGLAAPAGAQLSGGEFAAKMAENTAKLKQYTYMQKTQVYFKGELRTTKLSQVHFDSTTGERIVVPMNSGDAEQQPEQGRGGRLRARIVEKKRDEMKEYVERLVGLLHQYLPPNPDRIKAAMPRAEITPPEGGSAKIVLSDYLKPGDKETFAIGTESKRLEQIAISSSLDDDPVSFTVNFARLPDDTNYPSATTIQSQAKGLEIRVSTSDYHK
jgi:hypothetical protein